MDAMKLQSVKSSNIESVGYDPASKTMQVKFRSGSTHEYGGISPEVHAAFMGASSHGAHYAAHVRGRYPGKKLDAKPA
jgi:hypothetical protein